MKFERADRRWWNKPLVYHQGRVLPAELVILRSLLGPHEEGAWMNSRGRKSGVVDLKWTPEGKARTVRRDLPDFVAETLDRIYAEAQLARGCPDLVIWHPETRGVRLVEVKCPHWDRPSADQYEFMRIARERGVPVQIAEWEFFDQVF